MAFQDRELTCRDCGGAFVFTAGEQEFYATKGLEHDPVRCPSCRATRKMMRPETATSRRPTACTSRGVGARRASSTSRAVRSARA